MPKKNYILNLPCLTIKKVTGENPVYIEASYRGIVRCIHCNNKKLRKKASFIRRVRHESIGLRRSYLLIKGYKYHCSLCQRYFNQRFPEIRPYQRASEPLHRQVFHQHSQGVSQKDLARDLHCGKSTIERWYHEGYTLRHKKLAHRSCPRVLGIDEHFFNKKEGYATTFCDLAKHKVFDIVKGRSERDLNTFLNTLEGKDKVRVVCIDFKLKLSSPH